MKSSSIEIEDLIFGPSIGSGKFFAFTILQLGGEGSVHIAKLKNNSQLIVAKITSVA
jgi:hypothetical protein